MDKDRQIEKLRTENQVLRDKIKTLVERSRQLAVNLNMVKAENVNLQSKLWRMQENRPKKPLAPDTD